MPQKIIDFASKCEQKKFQHTLSFSSRAAFSAASFSAIFFAFSAFSFSFSSAFSRFFRSLFDSGSPLAL